MVRRREEKDILSRVNVARERWKFRWAIFKAHLVEINTPVSDFVLI